MIRNCHHTAGQACEECCEDCRYGTHACRRCGQPLGHNPEPDWCDSCKKAMGCEHENGEGCFLCCDDCNYDTHICKGCGEHLEHGQQCGCDEN